MTLDAITLDQYFHKIVNTQPKELAMLDVMKAKWTEFWTQNPINTSYQFVDNQSTVTNKFDIPEDTWVFGIHTGAYVGDGESVEAKEDIIVGHDGSTWMEVLDQILDVLGHHYGYNIKEQVYYSVHFPINEEGFAGYGRCLNDALFQQILLVHPELYHHSKESFEI